MKDSAHLSFLVASRLLTAGTRRVVIHDKHWRPVRDVLDGGYIFAVNHPTSLDPAYLYDLIYKPVILATDFIFNLPGLGWIFRGIDSIPVPVTEGDPRRHQAYCAALNALYCGRNLIVAPTGEQGKDDETKPAKSGIGRLSNQAGRSIVPVSIRHMGKIWNFHISKNGRQQLIRWMPVGWTKVHIGPPMCARVDEDPKDLANRVLSEIRRLSVI